MCVSVRARKEDMLLVGWGPAGRISPSPPSHGTAMRIDCIAGIPFRPHTGGLSLPQNYNRRVLRPDIRLGIRKHTHTDTHTIDITICSNIVMLAGQRFVML